MCPLHVEYMNRSDVIVVDCNPHRTHQHLTVFFEEAFFCFFFTPAIVCTHFFCRFPQIPPRVLHMTVKEMIL